MKVDKTPLPGIGMRKDIVTSSGRRIGTVTQRDGETALIISRQDDPDACLASIPLTADEAATLGNLLGAHQLVAQLTEEHRDLPGVNTRQFLITRGSPFEGYRLGDTRMRTRTGASVVAALRDGKVEPSPTPDFTLQAGDLLVGTSERRTVWTRPPKSSAAAESGLEAGSALTLIELGAVFFCLGILGRLAGRIGLSPIPLYLLGGLFFGHGGFIELEGLNEFSEIASEIGVILLLLMLGLEYTAKELVTGLRQSWLAGVLDIVLNFTPGAVVALLLGWGPVGAMVMGGVTYISSSGIVAKVLNDLGRLGNRETPVILSLLVFEDLAMAVYLPILTTVLAGASFAGGMQAVGISLVVVTVVLIIALRFGNVVSAIVDSKDREVFLLTVLGAALLVAGVAAAMQVSAAVGAFLLGIAISGATATNATRLLEPLRDLFAAIFFVVFGLNTDPATIPPVLGIAILLVLVTATTKIATGWWAARQHGVGRLGRARAGVALIARGEFSIVIAGLSVASGAITGELAALATAYVLLTAVLGPVAARLVEPVMGRLQRPRPESLPAT